MLPADLLKRARNLGAWVWPVKSRPSSAGLSAHNVVILSAAKDLIAGCNGHEILHFVQDDNFVGAVAVRRQYRWMQMPVEEPTYRPILQEELSARAFDGVLFSPDLSLDDLDFSGSRFHRCLFAVPIVRSADFSEAEFTDCRFEPARFASCIFVNARLTGCILFDSEAKKGSTFANCDMHGLEIAKCNLATGVFERCDLYNVTAKDSSFRGARFQHSTFTKALSKRSLLTKATFDTCNFSFADLAGLNLQRCSFRSCKFSEASFIGTDLSQATMMGCALDRIEWDRARLGGADLRGSRISGLNLATVSDYAGLLISESEQAGILEQLGIKVGPG